MKINPKYAFLHVFFLICVSCPFQNLSIWPKTYLFSNFARFCTPKRCTRVHCLVLKNNPNYMIFLTRMISNFKYKCPPPPPGPAEHDFTKVSLHLGLQSLQLIECAVSYVDYLWLFMTTMGSIHVWISVVLKLRYVQGRGYVFNKHKYELYRPSSSWLYSHIRWQNPWVR